MCLRCRQGRSHRPNFVRPNFEISTIIMHYAYSMYFFSLPSSFWGGARLHPLAMHLWGRIINCTIVPIYKKTLLFRKRKNENIYPAIQRKSARKQRITWTKIVTKRGNCLKVKNVKLYRTTVNKYWCYGTNIAYTKIFKPTQDPWKWQFFFVARG